MDKDFDTLAEKVAEYIGTVQPQLDRIPALEAKISEFQKQAEAEKSAKADFAKKATMALGALAKAGLISQNDVTPMVEKSAEDPSYVWGLMEKIAGSVGPQTLGSKSRVAVSGDNVDPWVREFCNYSDSSGMGLVD